MYNKAKFLRYIKGDMFLKFTWEQYKKTTPKKDQEAVLQAMFNSYVADNSVSLRAYKNA